MAVTLKMERKYKNKHRKKNKTKQKKNKTDTKVIMKKGKDPKDQFQLIQTNQSKEFHPKYWTFRGTHKTRETFLEFENTLEIVKFETLGISNMQRHKRK